ESAKNLVRISKKLNLPTHILEANLILAEILLKYYNEKEALKYFNDGRNFLEHLDISEIIRAEWIANYSYLEGRICFSYGRLRNVKKGLNSFQESVLNCVKGQKTHLLLKIVDLLDKVYEPDEPDLPQTKLEIYSTIVSIAEELDDKILKAKIHFVKVQIHLQKNDMSSRDVELALENYQVAYQLSLENKDLILMAKTFKAIGLVYKKNREYNTAIKNFLNSLNLWKKMDNSQETIYILDLIVATYSLKEDWSSALTYFKESFSIKEELGEISSYTYKTSSEIYFELGEVNLAIENLKQAILLGAEPPKFWMCSLMTSSRNDEVKSQLEKLLAMYKKANNYDGACEFLLEAMFFFKQTRNSTLQAVNLRCLGSICLLKGDLDESEKFLTEALELSEKIGYEALMVDILQELGRVYYSLRDINKAIDYWNDCFLMLEQYETNNASYFQLLDIFDFSTPKETTDYKYWLELLKLWRKTDNRREIARALKHLAMIAFSVNDWEGALGYWKESLDYWQELNNEFEVVRAYHHIGKCYYEKSKVDDAVKIWNNALNVISGLIKVLSGNIWWVYRSSRARKHWQGSLEGLTKISEELGLKEDVLEKYETNGYLALRNQDYKKTLDYLLKCLESKKLTIEKKTQINYIIGWIYKSQGHVDTALKFLMEAFQESKKLEDKEPFFYIATTIGEIHFKIGNSAEISNLLKSSKSVFV
ncbi:MAG: tetratricopeptide repeat protein, partial [Candidatus Hodarchaeota archaeon]